MHVYFSSFFLGRPALLAIVCFLLTVHSSPVTDMRASPEVRAIVLGQGELMLQPTWQIGIGDEVPAECDQIGISLLQDFFCAVAVEAAGGDDRTVESAAQER